MKSRYRLVEGLALVFVIGVVGGSFVLSNEETIAFDKLPKVVVDAIKARFPKAELVEAESEKDDGRTVYEVKMKVDGAKLDVKVAENGGILAIERKIAISDLPTSVSDAIAAKYKGAKISKAEEVTEVKYEVKLETADGKTIEVVYDPSGAEDDDDDK